MNMKLIAVSIALLLSSISVTESIHYIKSGGCLSENTTIPYISAEEFYYLPSRINQIQNGDTKSRKIFENRERCLPYAPYGRYLEYRLYPNKADANRIVRQQYKNIYYFTQNHYASFYKVY